MIIFDKLYIFIGAVLLVSPTVNAQGIWQATTTTAVTDRYDDIYFLNPDTGWAVSLDCCIGQTGQILKTTDGGITWIQGNASSTAIYRDIGFLDDQTGFVGILESDSFYNDTAIMYQSSNGGNNWYPVTSLPGPRPAGICGMCVINDSTLYAVGRYFGPAGFYKTTNKGTSWTYIAVDSLAGGLVDVYFANPDTGFAVGTTGNWYTGSGVILHTSNGGNNWEVIRTTDRDSEICWKLSFPSSKMGYISIESFRTSIDSQFCLKTIDGGQTWNEVYFTTEAGAFNDGGFDAQGIGFINDNLGWIGGRDSGTLGKEYKTEDGGATWSTENWGRSLNRFRWVGDGIAYFSGSQVYKFQISSGIASITNALLKLYPDPATGTLYIAGLIDQTPIVVTDLKGQVMISDMANGNTMVINISQLPAGVYFLNNQKFVKE